MSGMATATNSVQIGYLDSEMLEVIELINSYVLPADFFLWLSNASFTQKLMQEKIHEEKYTRISQFYIQNSLVFTGRAEFNLRSLPKETVQFLTSKKLPMITSIHECLKFRKSPISQVSADLYYTVISQLVHKDENIGFAWEIYELPEIIKIYNNLHDPLRHWKNY
jgi:hypothetical protein